jgi:glucose-1-phosphate adenylyltransferase
MDCAKMLKYHKEKGADCTIAVIDVPIEEASRFGIMSTNEDGSIYKFSEKPKNPDSTNASMGIYIFNKDKLQKYLTDDENTPGSSNDFGKNIIPSMLADGQKMFAYPFEGYWKDVGTINSLWEANMDLLGTDPVLDLGDTNFKIYSRNQSGGPQFIGANAKVINCYISDGCEIYGTVKNCVLGAGVKIMPGAYVKDSVLMGDTVVGSGATVNYSIIDTNVEIGAGAIIGAAKDQAKGITVLGEDIEVPNGAVIEDGAIISEL